MEGHAFYQKLSRFSLFYDYFAFLDVEPYAADQLLIQHQVTVHFVREYGKPGCPYRIILCKVRKRDATRFRAAMVELPDKLRLLGYSDYLDVCHTLWGNFEKTLSEQYNHTISD